MSAWIVTRNHINTLVMAALRYRFQFDGKPVTEKNASEVGQALWEENHASIRYRYGRGEDCPKFTFNPTRSAEHISNPCYLLKAASCYDYQTCEHPEYGKSAAKAFINDLELAAAREYTITQMMSDPDYTSAPWGIP